MQNHTYFCLYSEGIRNLGDIAEIDNDILYSIDYATPEDRKELSKIISLKKHPKIFDNYFSF